MTTRVHGDVPNTLMIKADRSGYEELLPKAVVLFIHRKDDSDMVRIAVPPDLVPGIGEMSCACCGEGALRNPDGSFSLDIPLADVDWWVEQ